MTKRDLNPGYRPSKWVDADDLIVRHRHGTITPLCHYCHLPMIGGECWQCDAPLTENVEETVQLDGGDDGQ